MCGAIILFVLVLCAVVQREQVHRAVTPTLGPQNTGVCRLVPSPAGHVPGQWNGLETRGVVRVCEVRVCVVAGHQVVGQGLGGGAVLAQGVHHHGNAGGLAQAPGLHIERVM